MSPEDDADRAAREWLAPNDMQPTSRPRRYDISVDSIPSLADLLRFYGQQQREQERVASFCLFNDAMNEFAANMKIDEPMARETMKRRMLDAVKASP